MSAARPLLALGCASAALALAACESTQSESARLERSAAGALDETGVVVRRSNRAVEVVETAAVQDENGTAVAVELRNRSGRNLAGVPLTIDVRGARGESLFRNDEAGLEQSLVSVSHLPAGDRLVWVHDQVDAAERPRRVVARVGAERSSPGGPAPQLEVLRVRVEDDPIEGAVARGRVRNRSRVTQRGLVLFGTVRRGGRVVAAGRAQIGRLRAGASAQFRIFFIGDPRGGRLEVAVPPTVLR